MYRHYDEAWVRKIMKITYQKLFPAARLEDFVEIFDENSSYTASMSGEFDKDKFQNVYL